ncbi:uncharacterized protein TNCV_3459931 [Trichonephila clavipes]|nr:uncharacterized protein TNCV_3459931 [Trichonephila clavipes]
MMNAEETSNICDRLSCFNASDSPSAFRILHSSSGGHETTKTTACLLNVPRQIVSDAICRFKELDRDVRRPGIGRKRTVNPSKNYKRVLRNPRFSMRQIARDMVIIDRSVRRIAKTELGLKHYKLR